MEEMKKAIGEFHVTYSVECPHCGETNYSNLDYDNWQKLEWGDGYPYGTLECSECEEEFNVEIEG